MKSIAMVTTVRKNSQRVPNKLLKPFADSDLFNIYLDKLESFRDYVYIVAYEQEFIDIIHKRGFRFFPRSEESANGEISPVIHSYLNNMEEDFIYLATCCCPLMKVKTLKDILNIIEKNYDDPDFNGLITVRPCTNIIWNSRNDVINDDASVFNTKLRKPFYIETSSVIAFRRKKFLERGVYFDFKPRDPEFYVINQIEATDIDTMDDFEISEIIYNRHKKELL